MKAARHRTSPSATASARARPRGRSRRSSPSCGAGCTPSTAPLALAAGIVLVAALAHRRHPDRVGDLRGHGAGALHRLGDLPPRHLEPAHLGVPAPVRPLQHLPADRRQLHAVHAPAARGRPASILLSDRLERRRRSASCSGCSGSARRGGSTPRSTSRWAGRRSSSSATSSRHREPRSSRSWCVGGALYTVGGLVYGFQRPNPFPRWFGFHEVFHTLTIVAFVTHYVGVSIATYSLR